MSDHHLTVVRDFGSYRRGDHIEDASEIARILGGEMKSHVVKVHADPKPKIQEALPAEPEKPAEAATQPKRDK